jgi:SNF2 family DNA or RNA helicase
VVVPANLIQQWVNEIRKHTTGLSVLIMKDGKQALPPARELLTFDIILFTKSRFDKEAKLCTDDTNPEGRSSLRDIHFKRLIYDEGHTLGNSSNSSPTETFTLVNKLEISARWVVSGSKF